MQHLQHLVKVLQRGLRKVRDCSAGFQAILLAAVQRLSGIYHQCSSGPCHDIRQQNLLVRAKCSIHVDWRFVRQYFEKQIKIPKPQTLSSLNCHSLTEINILLAFKNLKSHNACKDYYLNIRTLHIYEV